LSHDTVWMITVCEGCSLVSPTDYRGGDIALFTPADKCQFRCPPKALIHPEIPNFISVFAANIVLLVVFFGFYCLDCDRSENL